MTLSSKGQVIMSIQLAPGSRRSAVEGNLIKQHQTPLHQRSGRGCEDLNYSEGEKEKLSYGVHPESLLWSSWISSPGLHGPESGRL